MNYIGRQLYYIGLTLMGYRPDRCVTVQSDRFAGRSEALRQAQLMADALPYDEDVKLIITFVRSEP